MLPNIINSLMQKRRPDGLASGLMGDAGFYPSDSDAIPLGGQVTGDEDRQPYIPPGGMERFTKFPEPDMTNIGQGSGRSLPQVAPPPSNDTELQQSAFESQPDIDKSPVAPPPGFSDLTSPGIPQPEMLDPKKYDAKGNLLLDYEKDPEEIVKRGLNGELVGKSKWWKRALRGALDGLATGGLGGAIAGAAIEGFYPKSYQKLRTNEKVGEAKQTIDYRNQQEKTKTDQDYKKAVTADILAKPADRDAALQQKYDQQKAITERQIASFENRMKIHAQDADIKAGIATTFTDKNGKVWKKFLRADSQGKLRPNEPLVNPTTGEQEFNPGEQMVIDPLTGHAVKAKQLIAGQYAAKRQDDQQAFTEAENEKKRQFTATFGGAKAQFQLAMKQLGAAQAQQNAVNSFVKAFTNKNKRPPNQSEIDGFISAITAPDDPELEP